MIKDRFDNEVSTKTEIELLEVALGAIEKGLKSYPWKLITSVSKKIVVNTVVIHNCVYYEFS